jgi:type I restriction enzyme, S subunit
MSDVHASRPLGIDGWRRRPLREFGRVVGGGTPSRSRSSYWAGPIPWASVKDFTDEAVFLHDTAEHISQEGLASSAATLVPRDTPVVCTRMAVGRCALTTQATAINQDLKAFLLKRDIDPRFFIRLLRHYGFVLDRISIGSTVRGITLTDLLSLEVIYPTTTTEQSRIAAVLDTVDAAIAETETIIAKLKQVRAGLLSDLLTRGISPHGQFRPPATEAPQMYQDSPIGKFPKEWKILPLERLLAHVPHALRSGPFGSALLKQELKPQGIPLLGIDNVYTEDFIPEYTRFVDCEKFVELIQYAVRPLDVMITIMGTVGRCCVVPASIGKALSSKHVWTITLDPKRYSPAVACWQMNFAPWILRQLRRDEQGGVMAAIRSDTIRNLLLPVPDPHEIEIIEHALSRASQRIEVEKVLLHKLRKLQSGLVTDLLSGRVRVPQEARLAEVPA